MDGLGSIRGPQFNQTIQTRQNKLASNGIDIQKQNQPIPMDGFSMTGVESGETLNPKFAGQLFTKVNTDAPQKSFSIDSIANIDIRYQAEPDADVKAMGLNGPENAKNGITTLGGQKISFKGNSSNNPTVLTWE